MVSSSVLSCYVLLSSTSVSHSFISLPLASRQALLTTDKLFGLPEWRNQVRNDGNDGRELLLLPFSVNQTLLQGQSTEIILKHGRFFDLFQDCIDDYESIVGMALMGDDTFLKTMPLCEINDFEVLSGYRGKITVRVTLRAVARARLTRLTQMQPVMMGLCEELVDLQCPDLERANELVDDIEATISEARREQYEAVLKSALEICGSQHTSTDGRRCESELTAASWAIFSVLSDKGPLKEAITSDKLIDRLQLGLNAILDEKLQLPQIPSISNDGTSVFD